MRIASFQGVLSGNALAKPTLLQQGTPPALARFARFQVTTAATSDKDAGSAKAKLAVAAKISAAKTLARKLTEEKQAAAAAAQLSSQRAVPPEAAAELVRTAEVEVAEFAKEAAAADAAARAAVSDAAGGISAAAQELQKLKAENAALQDLLMQLADDREEAERRLEQLKIQGPSAVSQRSSSNNNVATTSSKMANTSGAAGSSSSSSSISSISSLKTLVEAANTQNLRVTSTPESPVAVGSTITVLYNLAASPLPHSSATPVVKLGLNRWETITKIPMKKVESLSDVGDWWSADIALPKLLFRVDFVVEDANSGAVDNNSSRDFQLCLQEGAPTAEEVTAARLKMLEDAEAEVQKEFDAEENDEYKKLVSAAEGAAKEARLAYSAARKEKILQEAKIVVAERRDSAAVPSETSRLGVWAWAAAPEAGATAVVLYNRATGPLSTAGSVVLHVGYDNWWMKDKRVLPMRPVTDSEMKRYAKHLASVATDRGDQGLSAHAGDASSSEPEWWCAEVPVWNTAATLDFAFTNDARTVWDNDQGKDYHTSVRRGPSGEKLVQLVFQALESAGVEESVRGETLAYQRVMQRAVIKASAARRRREFQRRFLYTKPITPAAGQKVTVYYNPDRTVLRGRPDVFVRGSFNRWNHAEQFGPIPMTPAVPEAGGLGFLAAEVDVPADAHIVDLVFQDSADLHGGFVDDNRGLDYRVPISGASSTTGSSISSTSAMNRPLRIAHVASEMAPIAKAGGLGDVVTALGRAVLEEGHDVQVVLPKYDCIDYNLVQDLVMIKEFTWEGTEVKVWKGLVEDVPTIFLEPCNGLFWVGRIYTDMNADRHRFGVFCSCALRWLLHESPAAQKPDVLHAHDWQSAPLVSMNREGVAAAFTIHNLNYGADLIGAAMNTTNVATTVSPTYATEIAGHPSVAAHQEKFYGIRNGIDMDIWDPASDPFLPEGFTVESAARGKAASKAELRRRMGLAEGDVPLVGCVTRLTHQKGIHLIKHAAWRAMERGAQFVLLGSAPDSKVQAEFDALAADLARQYPDRARLWFAYDEPLSHLIYAGSDLFLVPSMFEPCGLTQMIAMRYGGVPVVRRTGGLADTVFDVDDDAERAALQGMAVNGYSFDGADSAGMDYALNRALSGFHNDKEQWKELVERNMSTDWSWSSPAIDYIELYYKALREEKNPK
jgi:starch synthase